MTLHSRFSEKTAGVPRRTVTASAVLATATLLSGGGRAWARGTGDITVRLPRPTGPHRVGTTMLHLVDPHRRDPWGGGSVREVMVSVYYPARSVRGCPVAPQMTPGAVEVFKAFDPVYLHPELPKSGVDWAATMSHSHTGAPALPIRRPVLLYTPGGANPRTIGTGLAEELASHGNVVVTVDHPGEPGAVEFPDGRVRTFALTGDPREGPTFRTLLGTRLADLRFVLNQLSALATGHNPDAHTRPLPQDLGRALDLRRVGVYGHSAGGAAASQALYEDRRVRAAVNLEGYLDYPPDAPGQDGELLPVARYGVNRPLLLFGTDGYHDARFERSWSAMLAHPDGRTRRRRIDDAQHWVFTDYAAMAPQFQSAGLMSAADRNKLVGAITPAESVPGVRDRVRSFFSRHLSPR
ncbi:alpha/beta hydrolase [Streptomyces inusitatus]|uniref:alpha/beta hydrolase n=1 Tax=Streptomyces inusitatus TaxID=68221 RepID=UPI00167CFE85|nr:alpha/beta hydrolase [Streptomyces inusitatus]